MKKGHHPPDQAFQMDQSLENHIRERAPIISEGVVSRNPERPVAPGVVSRARVAR